MLLPECIDVLDGVEGWDEMTATAKTYVLIVDDDPDAREVMARVVGGLGLEARMAGDGLEALDRLRAAEDSPPLIILLDLMMPKLDGFAVYSWLRGNPRTRHIPVIVITACARDQINMFHLPGVYGVLQKGAYSVVDLSKLIDQVRNPAFQPAVGPARHCGFIPNGGYPMTPSALAKGPALEES
jgi:CheY-like chemotaxis protein